MPEYRIFLVDDHALVCEGLANLLRQQPDIAVCGQAQTFADAMQGILKCRPDIAIVDLSLESGSGLDLIKQVAARAPDTRVIVLSMHDEKIYAERVLRAGARGYVMKRETAKTIVAAIRQVLKGDLYLSARLQAAFAQKFVRGNLPADKSPIEKLSDRELEVFRLLGQGLPTREIAHSIGLSAKTVHTYYARIRDKLRLEHASEMVREAIRWCDAEPGA